MAADLRWDGPFIRRPDGVLHGHEALRAWLASVWRAMPDFELSLVGKPMVSSDGTWSPRGGTGAGG